MPFLQIQNDKFPFLYSGDQKIEWNSGKGFEIQINSNIIKITQNQIQWFMKGRAIKSLFKEQTVWSRLPCKPHYECLCKVQCSNDLMLDEQCTANTSLRLFATDAITTPVFINDLKVPNSFLPFVQGCVSINSNRQLRFDDTEYEVSLCDLTDSKLEFVLDTKTNSLLFSESKHSIGMVIIIVVTVLFFFVKVCEKFSMILSKQQIQFSHFTCTLPCFLGTLVLLQHGSAALMSDLRFVVQEEMQCDFILAIYTIVYNCTILYSHFFTEEIVEDGEAESLVAAHHCTDIKHTIPSQHSRQVYSKEAIAIGPLISVQLMLTARLNNTYDTPFFYLLLQLFSLRHFFKFLNLVRLYIPHWKRQAETASSAIVSQHVLNICQFFMDSIVLYLLFVWLVRITCVDEHEVFFTSASNFLISILLGTILHAIVDSA